jgi:hypothetical protein
VTVISVVAVTLDPDSVFIVGRLRPLVDEVLADVREELGRSLPAAPEVITPAQMLGLSVARGAVHASLRMARATIGDAALQARRQHQGAKQSAAAF